MKQFILVVAVSLCAVGLGGASALAQDGTSPPSPSQPAPGQDPTSPTAPGGPAGDGTGVDRGKSDNAQPALKHHKKKRRPGDSKSP